MFNIQAGFANQHLGGKSAIPAVVQKIFSLLSCHFCFGYPGLSATMTATQVHH